MLTAFALPLPTRADDREFRSPRYLVSLGTSLAVGVQPNEFGVNQLTEDGYPDQLFRILRRRHRNLHLVKLGCPGETTVTMIEGGLCPYPHGSQLDEAVSFLQANPGKTALITLDIGVNDLLLCVEGTSIDMLCLLEALQIVGANLPQIIMEVQTADPYARLVGMDYYNPFLAFYLQGPEGQAFAEQTATLATLFNEGVLGGTYEALGIPVAPVARFFQSDNFTTLVPFPLPPPNDRVPLNVVLICRWTWMCAPPPVGPNIHANTEGYAVIAFAFLRALATAELAQEEEDDIDDAPRWERSLESPVRPNAPALGDINRMIHERHE